MISQPPVPVLEIDPDGSSLNIKVTAAYVHGTMFFLSFDKYTDGDLTGTPTRCENRNKTIADSTANKEWGARFASQSSVELLEKANFAYPGEGYSGVWSRETASCHQVRYVFRTNLRYLQKSCNSTANTTILEYVSSDSKAGTVTYKSTLHAAYVYPQGDNKASGTNSIIYSLGFTITSSPTTGEIVGVTTHETIKKPSVGIQLSASGNVQGYIDFENNSNDLCNPSFTVLNQELNFAHSNCIFGEQCAPGQSSYSPRFSFTSKDRYLTMGGKTSQVAFTVMDCSTGNLTTINGVRYNVSFIDETSAKINTDNRNDPYIRAANRAGYLVIALSTQLGKALGIDDFHVCKGITGSRRSVTEYDCPASDKVDNILYKRISSNIYELYGASLPETGIVYVEAPKSSTSNTNTKRPILAYDMTTLPKINDYSEFEIDGPVSGGNGGDDDTGDSFAAYSLGVGAVVAGIAMLV